MFLGMRMVAHLNGILPSHFVCSCDHTLVVAASLLRLAQLSTANTLEHICMLTCKLQESESWSICVPSPAKEFPWNARKTPTKVPFIGGAGEEEPGQKRNWHTKRVKHHSVYIANWVDNKLINTNEMTLDLVLVNRKHFLFQFSVRK